MPLSDDSCIEYKLIHSSVSERTMSYLRRRMHDILAASGLVNICVPLLIRKSNLRRRALNLEDSAAEQLEQNSSKAMLVLEICGHTSMRTTIMTG